MADLSCFFTKFYRYPLGFLSKLGYNKKDFDR